MKIINHTTCNLHSLHKSEVLPGVSLTCINTDKFKAGCITFNLLCELRRDTASLNALLPRVLRRGTKSLPDMDSISAALDDLYGVRIEPVIRKKGEVHCIGFYADFPDDRYIPGNISLIEKTINIIGEMLLSPAKQDGLLRKDYIESEKSNLIDDIRAAINDKRGYAVDRLLEEMCSEEAFGISKLGNEESALAITDISLSAHYRDVVRNSMIEVIYCGSASPERIIAAVKPVFVSMQDRGGQIVPGTKIIYEPVNDTPRHFRESLDVTQGKLTIGFRIGEVMKEPDYPALMMLNAIYGGSVSSKLFLNVRERLSLCYYASSMTDKHKGLMIVSSGVEFSKFDTALDEILSQLESVKSGDISEVELTSAKRAIKTSISSALDRPGGLEELYFDSIISLIPYDPIKLGEMVEDVTLDRIVNSASGIKLDSIYLLSGLENKEVNDETC